MSITPDEVMILEAFVDTAADITLMSASLFAQVQDQAAKVNKTLEPKKCSLNMQAYSSVSTQMDLIQSILLLTL